MKPKTTTSFTTEVSNRIYFPDGGRLLQIFLSGNSNFDSDKKLKMENEKLETE
jgi:hypothetical protein